jgi:surface antigen
VVGAIAQWHSHERSARHEADGGTVVLSAGQSGHVAVVTAVMPDGQAQWVEFGWGAHPGPHTGFGKAPRYLYLGVDPPAGSTR